MASTPSLPSIMLAWSFEPSVVLGLVIAAATYVAGLYELARRGRPWRTVTHRHAVSFMLGLLAVLLALLSPIDTFAGRLFALHMLQHLLLLMVAPPLLLLGKPLPVLLVGAPRGLVRRIARAHARTPWLHGLTRRFTSPLVAWPLYVGDIWLWHMPALYQLALQHQGVHLLEHVCFLGTGILFWWVVINTKRGLLRTDQSRARLLLLEQMYYN